MLESARRDPAGTSRDVSSRPRTRPGSVTPGSATGGPGVPTSPCPCSPWPGSSLAKPRPSGESQHQRSGHERLHVPGDAPRADERGLRPGQVPACLARGPGRVLRAGHRAQPHPHHRGGDQRAGVRPVIVLPGLSDLGWLVPSAGCLWAWRLRVGGRCRGTAPVDGVVHDADHLPGWDGQYRDGDARPQQPPDVRDDR
jgi:hypothetical protein